MTKPTTGMTKKPMIAPTPAASCALFDAPAPAAACLGKTTPSTSATTVKTEITAVIPIPSASNPKDSPYAIAATHIKTMPGSTGNKVPASPTSIMTNTMMVTNTSDTTILQWRGLNKMVDRPAARPKLPGRPGL